MDRNRERTDGGKGSRKETGRGYDEGTKTESIHVLAKQLSECRQSNAKLAATVRNLERTIGGLKGEWRRNTELLTEAKRELNLAYVGDIEEPHVEAAFKLVSEAIRAWPLN